MLKDSTKKTWVAALRSGAYKQGRGVLRSKNNCFCCLGVLADACKVKWHKIENYSEYGFFTRDATSRLYLSPEFLNTIGLSDTHQMTLSAMNDDKKSFDEIADYIEEKIPAEPD